MKMNGFRSRRQFGEGGKGGGPAECAMAAYFASRKQVRLLTSAVSATAFNTAEPAGGAGRIQPLRAFRRAKMSKLDLGTIKNGSAASDLPPEGSKKRVGPI